MNHQNNEPFYQKTPIFKIQSSEINDNEGSFDKFGRQVPIQSYHKTFSHLEAPQNYPLMNGNSDNQGKSFNSSCISFIINFILFPESNETYGSQFIPFVVIAVLFIFIFLIKCCVALEKQRQQDLEMIERRDLRRRNDEIFRQSYALSSPNRHRNSVFHPILIQNPELRSVETIVNYHFPTSELRYQGLNIQTGNTDLQNHHLASSQHVSYRISDNLVSSSSISHEENSVTETNESHDCPPSYTDCMGD